MFSVSGFIKIPRAFFEGTLWCEARVFSRAEAFLDLVRLVRYRMGSVQDGPRGEKIPVGRGEVLVSLRNLGERWQWSAHRVKCFVDDLVKEGILCYETVGTGHKLTIQQYDSLYGRKIREERKIPRCGTASGTPPAPGHKGLSAGGGNSLGNTCGVQGTVVERKVAKEREEEKETSLEGGKEKLLSGATVQSGAVSPTSAGQGQTSPVAPSAATAAQDVLQGVAGSRPAVVQAVRPSALCLEPLVTAGYAELPLAECRTALVAERSWLETLTMNSRLSGHRELTLDGVRRWLDDFFRKLENEGVGRKAVGDAKSHFARWLNRKLTEGRQQRGAGASSVGCRLEDNSPGRFEDAEVW